MEGTIAAVKLTEGFGFIRRRGASRREVFFHRLDLRGLEFDEQLLERDVAFELEETPRGQRARNVRAAN